LWALEWAGTLVDRLRTGDAGEGGSPLGALHLMAGVVLFVLVGGHRLALAAFAETLSTAPVGAGASAADLAGFALGAGRIVTAALELALAFAAPAAIAFVLLELALGLASRAGSALRTWTVAMPLRAGLGVAVALIGLAALLPRLPPLLEGSIEAAARLVSGLGG
ncbi:MAG TPA: flagellar biosynthetic protein FliR, partial [Sandaracinaceae bacterium]